MGGRMASVGIGRVSIIVESNGRGVVMLRRGRGEPKGDRLPIEEPLRELFLGNALLGVLCALVAVPTGVGGVRLILRHWPITGAGVLLAAALLALIGGGLVEGGLLVLATTGQLVILHPPAVTEWRAAALRARRELGTSRDRAAQEAAAQRLWALARRLSEGLPADEASS
jgi:hypothetical protein